MTKLPNDFPEPPNTAPDVDLRADTTNIALTLSGGGYRASAFHLGTLAYLRRIKILSNLDRLSTVSGGTFTGAKYILSLVENDPFPKFFNEFYAFLNNTNLIELGLKDLSEGAVQVPSGQRKLINSLANVYASTFLMAPNGDPYTFGQILDADNLRVTEISFNTTEFRTGTAFRFQRTFSKNAKIGNYYVSISKDDAKKIRMADIVAASSCFPSGFEPIAFPQDFAWPNNQVPSTVKAAMAIPPEQQPKYQCDRPDSPMNPTLKDTLPLMDGGIYDNQGIDSLLLVDDRKNDGDIDLFIISDVDPTDEDLFPYPAKSTVPSWLTLENVNQLICLFLITCIVTVISIFGGIWRELAQGTFGFWKDFFSAIMPLFLSLLVTGTILYGRRLIREQLVKIPNLGIRSWKEIKKLKVDQFIYIISLRIESLLALVLKVFMKRIRSLIFAKIYTDPKYNQKRITNRIDRLIARPVDVDNVEPPSDGLKAVIKQASCMPTTLWFNVETTTANNSLDEPKETSDLEALVVAGQATICFNLMQYIVRVYGGDPNNYPEKTLELWQDLQKDWRELNETPCIFLEKLLNER